MTRRPLLAANWKMHKTRAEASDFLRRFANHPLPPEVDVVICPPFTALETASRALPAGVALGAQDVHWEARGAFTGEIAAAMLTDLGCAYVIVGHSERRRHFGEADEHVGHKARAAFEAGLTPIACVGETLSEREAGETEAVVRRQLAAILRALEAARAARLVVAYEPVWAIGTGRAATPDDAQQVAALIRGEIAQAFGAAESVRVLYGGSVTPENAAAFLALPDVDGALVGGASLDPDSFLAIVRAAGPRAQAGHSR